MNINIYWYQKSFKSDHIYLWKIEKNMQLNKSLKIWPMQQNIVEEEDK